MFGNIFKIVYFVEYVLISVVRVFHTRKYRTLSVSIDKKTLLDIVLLGLSGIGMVVPLIYIFSPIMDFADYNLPLWIGWLGAVLFAAAVWLLWRSHVDLGRNWTPTLGLRKGHELITTGIFKYIRHPMYAAHILWAVAQALMLHNGIAGFSLLVVFVPQYLSRVKAEEWMMLERFGEQYRNYMKKTGRIFPYCK
ncbi:MAG: isoprenylcysteine carboxylmethyltransferase family protein [Candidatus Aminicenantes bacterium]|nr:isoprenylcysteine carboxylmethyltransferase family protein [Candidatus Aminicenantes bacterium]